MQGRWQWCQMHRNVKRTTSGSHLDAREVVVVANASKREKHHLRLAFGCEGGGGGGKSVKMREKTTSGSRLDAREVVVANASKREKHHLRLAFGCEGGGGRGKGVGGGGKCVETRKAPPPARVWMRGRWWSWRGSWWWWPTRRNAKSTTSGSRLDAREVVVVARELVVVANASKREKDHLRLAFGCEGGGGSIENVRLQLAFSCKGGGGGVGRVEFVSMGHSRGRLVLARVLDSGVVSGTVGKEKTGEKRGTTEVIPRFVTHLVGRPLPGSPPPLLPAGFHRQRRDGSNRPTSLGGGEGRG